jgi:hypothetical protein
MANPLDFLSKAGNITNPLAIGATILGGIGSIFGSGSKREIPPELQAVYDMVMKQAKEGLSDEAIDAILRRTKTGLGQEAGALSSLTESRLTRSGAGVGVKEAALRRIDKERLRGIGEATTDTLLAWHNFNSLRLYSVTLRPKLGRALQTYSVVGWVSCLIARNKAINRHRQGDF